VSYEVPTPELRQLLAFWLDDGTVMNCRVKRAVGGLSGAEIWQVAAGDNEYCLRRWPLVFRSLEWLAAIHRLIEHVHRRGVRIVPVPLRTPGGDTIVLEQGPWELTKWLPGVAVEGSEVTPTVLSAAGETLARFHLAAADFSMGEWKPAQGPAPGLLARQRLLESLRDGQLVLLRRYVGSECDHPYHRLAGNMLDSVEASLTEVLKSVGAVSTKSFPLQWHLGDVHREHLLFTEGKVTGLIDFGAAAVGSVAGDVARLGGSLCGDMAAIWSEFLNSYETLRPLSAIERGAVAAYDAGGLIGAAANWIRWLLVEGQRFGSDSATEARLTVLESRLARLAETGGASMAARAWGLR